MKLASLNRNKKLVLLLISIPPLIGVFLTSILGTPFLVNLFFFYALPSGILLSLKPELFKKSLLFSLCMLIPMGTMLDYILSINSWSVNSVFPVRLFGVIPYEDMLWGFLFFFFVVIFYEFFLDRKDDRKAKKYTGLMLPIILLSTSIFIILVVINPQLHIPYFLHLAGIPLLLFPSTFFLITHRKLLRPLLTSGVYFFVHSIILEVISLKTGQWNFTGRDFIGWINILGVAIPFEEFFYWFVILAIAILTYYEFLWDDRK